MRSTSIRLLATLLITTLSVASLGPAAHAQQPAVQPESTQAPEPAPSPDPTLAQAQPPAPPAETTPPAPSQQTPPVPPMQTPPMPPAPVAPPAGPVVPATQPPTAQPTQPDLFQEQMKAEQKSAERKQALYNTGAVVTNVFLIPGRMVTCALGGVIGVAILAVTFGTQYKAAAGAFDEGCGGKWVVSGDDLKPDSAGRAFDWER
jgi:outer membrane biosynthesis protein TonB